MTQHKTTCRKLLPAVLVLLLSMQSLYAENSKDWQVKYFVDDFGDKTDEGYLSGIIEGTFSNVATNNSEAIAAVIYAENDGLGLELFDYGLSPVSVSFYENVSIKIKQTDGTIASFRGNAYNKGKRIIIDRSEEDKQKIKEILLAGGDIKIYITIASEYSAGSSYRFTLNTDGFKKAYEALYNK
jgi:hypothetical protein